MHAENKYAPLLEELATSAPQIQLVALSDLAGILKCIITRTTTSMPTPHLDELHVFLGCAIAQSFVQMGSLYEFNELHTVIIEYQRGTLLLAPTGTGVLIVLVNSDAIIGIIRYKMMSVAKKLCKLEARLETTHVPSLAGSPGKIGTKRTKIPLFGEKNPPVKKKKPMDDK